MTDEPTPLDPPFQTPARKPEPPPRQPPGPTDHPRTTPPVEHEGGLSGLARRWLGMADALLRRAAEDAVPDRVLSYREVVGYLVANRPPDAHRGVLLRRRRTGAWAFRLAFLGPDGDPLDDRGRVRGHVVLARDCDDELRELFGDRDLIVFD
ncbi:hypothetical protein [Saccharothrix variisporea]|uniref:Uncharacterized protein n=1 Tax=Saccharothrix variisporea TaxID=543527 RepID=A0A495X4J3_9PSEU|nr:hypothetical protein [Saccharothrix variisporea]RKT68155.1 hypothetical protein DFJ66_1336 [Saccharothrix variisporea]